MKDTLRTFIAVETNEAIRRRAEELIETLRAAGANVKWVARQNLHLTLKFLGDVPTAKISAVCETVQQVASGVSPFELQLRGAGAFPSTARPRTIWIGAAAGEAEIVALQKILENALRKLGCPPEGRRFEPHLTLGRLRGGGPAVAQLGRLLKQQDEFEAGCFVVGELVVFSSQLTPQGPLYSVLCRAGPAASSRP